MKNKEVILFKTKEWKTRSDVAAFLKQLAAKVDEGRITLKSGSDEVQVQFSDKLELEVELEDKDKAAKGIQHKLEIEIKWYDKDTEGGKLEIG